MLNLSNRFIAPIGSLILCGLLSQVAQAQLDRIYTHTSTTATSGTIAEETKDGITLKTGSNEKQFMENEIRKVMFQGDPAPLTRGREFAIDGQYEQALEELKGVNVANLPRDIIKADAEYYLLLCNSKLALAGRGDRNAAITSARNFASKYRDSFHFYSVTKLLGDLALSIKSYERAGQYYGFLANAPSAEAKIQSRYLSGVTSLESGDLENAQKAFSDVADVSVNSTEALRLKAMAKAGQAVALARSGKGQEGLDLVDKLIEDLNPTDIEMAARIYNAQGASYEATGDNEGAILAYLHTHLMFSGQPDAHAQALSRLVELWPRVGRAERANEARQELKQRYPGYAN